MSHGALVLAGGGVAGIAWETGVLFGLDQADPVAAAAILDASTSLIGTSAGSVVAAQLAGGTPLAELFDAQVSERSAEIAAQLDVAEFGAMMATAITGAKSAQEVRQRVGAIALNAVTVPSAVRRAVIAARLPVQTWGDRRLLITAVDAESGEHRVFDRDSGVSLVDAVTASCAVPGIWPVVEIGGRRYMDGGTRSLANADLAAGSDPVLVLVPAPEVSPMGTTVAQADLDALAPARVHVVYADAASLAAFGTNPLDPASRRPAALAGLELGHRIASEVAEFWGGSPRES
jgi:NTE family protein